MTYNLVIDADSILYTSCYNAQLVDKKSIGVIVPVEQREASFNIEKAYMLFCNKVASIERMVFQRHASEHVAGQWRGEDIIHGLDIDTEIIFSPKKTFRNDLSESYKANRKPSDIFGIGELKQMVFDRIRATQEDNVEADDVVITRACEKENVYIACIDKDIWTHSPVDCFNYNDWEWKTAKSQEEIEDEYIYQSILGDSTDGISGAKGKGKKFAEQFVYGLDAWTYDTWEKCFASPEEAELTMRLVRMDQFKKGEIILWTKP